MVTPVFLTISTVVLPAFLASPTRDCRFDRMGDPAAEQQALVRFEIAVNDYAELHRRLERAWPPMWFISDFEQLETVAAEFRAMLRDARPQAAKGGIFTPAVAEVFRFRIAADLREDDFDLESTALADDDTGTEGWSTPSVNEPLPMTGMGAVQPSFTGLPVLPPELDYRIVGRDLILLNVRANMVVDVLDLAVPARMDIDLDEED